MKGLSKFNGFLIVQKYISVIKKFCVDPIGSLYVKLLTDKQANTG